MSRAGTIWIASYPKSGNTWVRSILASLRAGGTLPDLATFSRLIPNSASLPWIEDIVDLPTSDMTPEEQRVIRIEAHRILHAAAPPPHWLKVHDAFDPELFAADITAGIIYVVRDPRDVAPSWADHMRIPLDAAIARMGDPHFTLSHTDLELRQQARQRLTSWSMHVGSWLDAAPAPLLLLRYEDMLDDPATAIAAIADFAGLTASPDMVAATAAACAFANLRRSEEQVGFVERQPGQAFFFRHGRAGDWRTALTPAQAGRIVADHGPVMGRLGYSVEGAAGS